MNYFDAEFVSKLTQHIIDALDKYESYSIILKYNKALINHFEELFEIETIEIGEDKIKVKFYKRKS